MPIPRLHRDRTALLVIDVQERLLPSLYQGAIVARHCGILMAIADRLGIPVLVTEQHVRGLGPSVPAVADRIRPDHLRVEKTRFSAAVPEVLRHLDAHDISSVLLCGAETHVCVLQTALDLLAGGRHVFLATDAITSGARDQIRPGFLRMLEAGALPTGVIGATYELLADSADPAFRDCLALVKRLEPLECVL
jgi:nicotinamidase-related amidase